MISVILLEYEQWKGVGPPAVSYLNQCEALPENISRFSVLRKTPRTVVVGMVYFLVAGAPPQMFLLDGA